MKAMKKVLFLALVLVMALSATAFATEAQETATPDLPGTSWTQLSVSNIVNALEAGNCPQCGTKVSGYGMEIKWDCTEKFTATVECGGCGTYTITKAALTSHENTATRELKDQASTATCVQDGIVKTEEYCTVCGKTVQVKTENSGKLTHTHLNAEVENELQYNAVNGNLQQTRIKTVVERVKAAMTEYDKKNVEITVVDATCTANGSLTIDCKVCDYVKTYKIEALGHAYGAPLALGGTTLVCEEEHDHDADCYVADAPACEKDAVLVQICSVCDDRLTTVIKAAPGHTYSGNKGVIQGGEIMQEGQQKGCEPYTLIEFCDCYGIEWVELEYTCEHYRILEEVKASWTHEDADFITNSEKSEMFIDNKATCTEDGKQASKCLACNFVDYKTIPATNHNWDDDGEVKTAPTCTQDGVMVVKCTNVNGNNGTACKATTEIAIKAVGHKEQTSTDEPSCNQTGLKVVYCTVCKNEVSREILPITHTWAEDNTGKPVGAASANIIWNTTEKKWETITCEQDGTFTFRCTKCPATQTIDVIAPKHVYKIDKISWDEETRQYVNDGAWLNTVYTTVPTCTENGVIVLQCENGCGTSKTFEGPKAYGHYTYADVVNTVIEPTCYDAGLVVKQCICGIKDTMAGDLLKHDLRMQGNKLFCATEGCTYTEEMEMDAQYTVSTLNVKVTDKTTSGVGKIELIEGMGIKDQPLYARINFNFTLDNGEDVAYVACVEIDEVDGTFRMASPSCPYGATLTNIAVMITTSANAQDLVISDVPNLGLTVIR